jgi:hypothetical protein
MNLAKRVQESDLSAAAAVNVAVLKLLASRLNQAGEGGGRPLRALAPEIAPSSVKSPFARSRASATLAHTSSTIRLESSVRRLQTNRWSGRVQDKVPSSYAGARAAQLKR